MKATLTCRACLEKLVVQTAELAADGPLLRERAKAEGLRVLQDRFSLEAVTTVIASEFQRVIREMTGNPDPFEGKKKKELAVAQEVSGKLYSEMCKGLSGDPCLPLARCVSFALAGNAIDFFVDPETLRDNPRQEPVDLGAGDIAEVTRALKRAKRVLYLADNAGECFFDWPLVQHLGSTAKTVYAVKGSPVQNDITLGDLEMAGLKSRVGRVMTTGNDFVGLDLESASKEFRREYESADLIVAKGMGYYETITELRPEGRVFFFLKAKCQPVADSLGVPLNTSLVRIY
ncbi:MAG: DUF89 family protein [Chloroflexi bacterium]|nr:DUF89 family protein [Chloroflexota bacterium]